MRYFLLFSALSASSAGAREIVAIPADSGARAPVITVSRAGHGVGQPIDIIAASRAARAARANAPTGASDAGAAANGARTARGIPWGAPVNARVTSRFGMRSDPLGAGRRMHSGTDLAAPMGTPVQATSDGVVAAAGWNGGYGLFVALDHGAGTQTRYGHLSRLAVARGQTVARGQVIGFVGSSGRSTGAHLHYEVRRNGIATDPAAAGLYAAAR